MDIENINFKKTKKLELIKRLTNGELKSLSKKEHKSILKKIEKAINSGDYLTTRNALIIAIFINCDETITTIKKKGLFRYSKYTNKKCIVKNIATELIDICQTFKCLTPPIKRYLDSIINYSTIINSYNSFDKFILFELRSFEKKYKKKSLIKTLLAAVDYLFLSNYFPSPKEDLSKISGRTKEEICSAVSYLIYFYTNRVSNKNIDTLFVAEEFVKSGDISRLIIPVCYNQDFREFEILIDHFNYTCDLVQGKISIKPPFEDFEKAIRLGYIRTDLQQINDKYDTIDASSIEELIDYLTKQDSFEFFKLSNTHNYQRYVVEMPEPVLDFIIEKFINPDALFKDEIIYLSSIFKEQLLNFDDLNERKIKDNLTLAEFMKIRRVFILVYLLFAKEIYKVEKVETELLLRSLIPVFPTKLFYEFIEKFLPTDKIDSFLDIVCWEPDLDIVFDLQYQPILFIENHFLLSLSIFANSNTIRNLYASQYKQNNLQLLSDGEIDPLVDKLHLSLQEASLKCYSETPIGFSDIDEFAVFGNVLFVFECKHSLHPVSPFDLRTTHDYIKKAERQLDLIIEDYHDGKLIKKLENKHSINLNNIKEIQGAIILSNRLFNGNVFKYPVRNINEIDNMLNDGTMRTSEGVFWLWKERKLTVEFLLDYLSLDNELITLLYESLSKKTLNYNLAKPEIEFDTYYLEVDAANTKLKEFTNNLEIKQ